MAGGLLRQEAIVVAVDSLEGFSSGSGIRDLTAEYEHVGLKGSCNLFRLRLLCGFTIRLTAQLLFLRRLELFSETRERDRG